MVKEPKKTVKKPVTVYRVMKNKQWRDFNTQEGAREHLIECLRIGAITFCSIAEIVAEEE